jgi:hypothetical protein
MGTMPQPEQTLVTGAVGNESNRYGDYAALSVDPINDQVFWFTGEYNPTGKWKTRIGAFQFTPSPTPTPSATSALLGPTLARPNVERRLDVLEDKMDRILEKLRITPP